MTLKDIHGCIGKLSKFLCIFQKKTVCLFFIITLHSQSVNTLAYLLSTSSTTTTIIMASNTASADVIIEVIPPAQETTTAAAPAQATITADTMSAIENGAKLAAAMAELSFLEALVNKKRAEVAALKSGRPSERGRSSESCLQRSSYVENRARSPSPAGGRVPRCLQRSSYVENRARSPSPAGGRVPGMPTNGMLGRVKDYYATFFRELHFDSPASAIRHVNKNIPACVDVYKNNGNN